MAEILRMPEVLAGATEAAIQTWVVQPGTAVVVDQTIAEIETDKAIVELSAESDGMIGRLLVAEGDTVAVGDPILVLLATGENESAIDAALAAAGVVGEAGEKVPEPTPGAVELGTASEAGTAAAPAGPEPETGPTAGPPSPALPPQSESHPEGQSGAESRSDGQRLFASPLVRRLAARDGVALAEIDGTGPHGRVVRRDLERHLAARTLQPAAGAAATEAVPAKTLATVSRTDDSGAFEDVPLDRMRKAIARRLTESKSTVPHFYLVADCRVDALLGLRTQINENAPRKISVNDFVLKAVAGALIEVPAANAIWNADSIRLFSSVDISVAVATDGGLTTPVVREIDRMPLSEVSATVADLADRARAGRLKQNELEGGSFAVSNLGMYGTTQFSAILNPPQSGILAVGAARKIPVVDESGQLAVGMVMTVTLSADHRVLDGAVAAQWLAAFQHRIENPLTILI